MKSKTTHLILALAFCIASLGTFGQGTIGWICPLGISNDSLMPEFSSPVVSVMNAAYLNYVPKYKSVTPPIKGIDVDRKYYTVNPETSNVITSESGTKIFIPENAFADAQGNPVKGPVNISYREFRDPIDFLVSGIPMKYDTAGEETNLKSAGEFEITASVDNQPVQLAKGKTINMNFASTTTDPSYNFYQYNDSTGNWKYINKLQAVPTTNYFQGAPISPACMVYKNFIHYEKRLKDSTLLNDRFESLDYVYTEKKDTSPQHHYLFHYLFEKKERDRNMGSLVKINQFRKTKEGKVYFKISFVNAAHPELRDFHNFYFEVNDNITASEFKNQFGKNQCFNDVRIYADGDDFEIKLKSLNEFKTINASLVTTDGQGKLYKIKNTKVFAKHYDKALNKRATSFAKEIKKGWRNQVLVPVPSPDGFDKKAYSASKGVMTWQEKRLSHDEWLTYCNNQVEIQKQNNDKTLAALDKSAATSANLVNSLSLTGMGIYNCDQIQRIKEPVQIYARYTNNKNEKLKPKATYIIDKNINGLLEYDGYNGFDAHKIAFSRSKNSQNIMLAVGDDGDISIYKTEEFKRNIFTDKEHFNFVVTPINSTFSSVADLKKLIGL